MPYPLHRLLITRPRKDGAQCSRRSDTRRPIIVLSFFVQSPKWRKIPSPILTHNFATSVASQSHGANTSLQFTHGHVYIANTTDDFALHELQYTHTQCRTTRTQSTIRHPCPHSSSRAYYILPKSISLVTKLKNNAIRSCVHRCVR